MILYGKPVAQKIYQNLKITSHPSLSVILIGQDPISQRYILAKEKITQKLGIEFKVFHLPAICPEKQVIKLIGDLNKNKYINGIVVQLPLPKEIDREKIISKISPQKDIDGFLGKFLPPTAQAILEIFKFYKINLINKRIVLVGYGRLVGEPLAKLLPKKGLKPIICTSTTHNLAEETISADILISAVGQPRLIKPEMVSEKAVVIDAGTSESYGKIVGDVDPEVYKKVAAYSPVPGGVGPVTVACLMRNLVRAAKGK